MKGIVEEWIIKGVDLLQMYGWYMVFAFIALYIAQPWISEMRARMSLYHAKSPDRVRVLDKDRQRVRLRQHLEFLRKNKDRGCGEKKDD